MNNWVLDKDIIIKETVEVVMKGLECLVDDCCQGACVNYWLSDKHNVYAEVITDSDGMWIDVKLEVYDKDDSWVGDLYVTDTKDKSRKSLEKAITEIVKGYYGEW